MIYDERMRMVLYNYVPNQQSRKDVIQAMKENLELEDHEVITEFSFSINEPYEKEIIGYGPYKSGNTYDLLPDFTGDSEAQARATASRLGISVNFVGGNGYVIDQEYPAGKRIDKIRGSVTLTLGGSRDEEEDDESDNQSDDTSTTKPDSGSGSSKPGSGTGGGSESGSGTGENGSGGSGSGGNGSDSGSGGNDGGNTGTDESGDGSTTTPTPPSE